MAVCGSCGTENPSAFRFCGGCGVPMGTATCPGCGFAGPDGLRFCGQCGTPMEPTPSAGRAVAPVPVLHERKLATVLFADVVGFTSMAERTDPEVVASTVDAAFRRLADVVAEHGGTVDKYMGDSLMAVFGVPVAHDDDAERAVAAGLAMRDVGGDLAFSIGVNSGEVMATSVGREGEVTVIGDTVNVAARLEKAAAPGEVLAGRLTAQLAERRVVFRERTPVLLKGKREPVEVHEAIALRPSTPEAAGRADGPPLIGRDDDLAFLQSHWRRVGRDGRSATVLLCGPAGSGKTRLIEELASQIGDAGEGQVVRAVYPAYGGLGGPRVAAQVIRQLGAAGDPEIDARVRSIAGDLHPSLQSIDKAAMQQEQLWAFRRLLLAKTVTQPLLIVVDDIHRSGDNTIGLLGELIVRVADAPILLLLSGRPEPAEWLGRFPAASTVRLGALSRRDAAALADAFVGDRPLAPSAAEVLVDKAGGNPLYLRELVAVVRAQGALTATDGEYTLAHPVPIPATIQAVLAARLDALEPAQKQALQLVSVVGDAATEIQVAALGLVEAGAALRSLVDCGLLAHGRTGGFDVIDPLLREVAYATLPRNLRGELHRRAATVAGNGEERARHLDRAAGYLTDDGAVAAEAAEALAGAGIDLIERYREADGVRLLERAVELGLREPRPLLRLAAALGATTQQAAALAMLDLVPDDPNDPSIGVERRHIAAATSLLEPAPAAVDELLAVADDWRALGNPLKEAWALANAGVSSFNLGRGELAAELLERAATQFRELGDRAGELSATSFLTLVRPDDPRIDGWLSDSLAQAEKVGDRTSQLNMLLALTWHRYLGVRWAGPAATAAAEDTASRMAALAQELGVDELGVQGECLRASMARLTGRLDEAVVFAERAASVPLDSAREGALVRAAAFMASLALCPGEPTVPELPDSPDPAVAVAAVVQGEALVFAGRPEESADIFNRAERASDLGTSGDLLGAGAAFGCLAIGLLDEAAQLVARVRRAAEARRASAMILAARAVGAEIAGRQGDPEGGRRLLEEIGDPAGADDGPSFAVALWLRARLVLGADDVAEQLHTMADQLGAPGLLIGLESLPVS